MLAGHSLVASLPDISEFQATSLAQWKEWFVQTAQLILSRCPDDGVVVFYQSDIKVDGVWVDKGYLVQKAAEAMGVPQLWHKLICRVPPGVITMGRPGYTHILCFSKTVRPDFAKSTADVLPEMGEKTWERGMGLEACVMIARFVREHTTCSGIVHPFCGQGAMLAAANLYGLDGIGIERGPRRAAQARDLRILQRGGKWVFDTAAAKG